MKVRLNTTVDKDLYDLATERKICFADALETGLVKLLSLEEREAFLNHQKEKLESQLLTINKELGEITGN